MSSAEVISRRCVLALLSAGFGGCTVHVNDETMFPHVPPMTEAGQDAFDTSSAQIHPLPVTSEGRPIEAWSAQRPNANGTVLFCSGNGTGAPKALGRFVQESKGLALNVVVWTYRGKHDPPPGIAATRAAARAVYTATAAAFAGKPVYVMGHSFGCWIALDLVAHTPVAGAILVAPGTTVRDVADFVTPIPFGTLLRLQVDPDVATLDSLGLAPAVRVPTLVVGSTGDRTMSDAFARRIYNALPEATPKRLLVFDRVSHQDYFAQPAF